MNRIETDIPLLPCPFCGQTAYLVEHEDWCEAENIIGAKPNIRYVIGCEKGDCICDWDLLEPIEKNKDVLISKWNHRYTPFIDENEMEI